MAANRGGAAGSFVLGMVGSIIERVTRALAILALALAMLLGEGAAWAHVVGISRCDLTVAPSGTVDGLIVFSSADAAALARHGGGDAEGAFRAFVARGLVLHADDAPCPGGLVGGSDVAGDGFALAVTFVCPQGARSVRADLLYVVELPEGHRVTARLSAPGASVEKMISLDDRTLTVDLPPSSAPPTPPASAASSLRSTVLLGAVHILRGWDHLLFLLALLLGVTRLRPLIVAISAFTVAHSITLACAALSLVVPSARVVEPLIALSIAVVAWGVARGRDVSHRVVLTFAFGLVHGFGFAGALVALALPRDRVIPALVGFNLGVELGQLAVVAATFPVLVWLRRGPLDERRVRLLGWGLVALGLALAAQRALAP